MTVADVLPMSVINDFTKISLIRDGRVLRRGTKNDTKILEMRQNEVVHLSIDLQVNGAIIYLGGK